MWKQLKIRDHSDLNLTSWGKDRLFTFLIPSLLMKEHHIKRSWSLTERTMQGEAFVYRWTVDCSYERLREVDQLWNLNWISRPFALLIWLTRKQDGCFFWLRLKCVKNQNYGHQKSLFDFSSTSSAKVSFTRLSSIALPRSAISTGSRPVENIIWRQEDLPKLQKMLFGCRSQMPCSKLS